MKMTKIKHSSFAILFLSLLGACGSPSNSPPATDPSALNVPGVGSAVGTTVGSITNGVGGTSASTGSSGNSNSSGSSNSTPASNCTYQALSFNVTSSITRSVSGLTEGFSFFNGMIYESTGLISGHGASVVNTINPATGVVTKLFTTPSQNFGEGLVELNGYFYQLTYQEGNIYKYTSDGTAKGTVLVGTYDNPLSEGWGLTTDGTNLLASDGSAYLYRIDPSTLKVISKVQVTTPTGAAITGLNELEYVDGQIYANIFPTNRMVRFDALQGCQTSAIDLTPLTKLFSCSGDSEACTSDSVTNGIAYDAVNSEFYLTGKSWPAIYKGTFE
jgi:glutamine cyclotransferase